MGMDIADLLGDGKANINQIGGRVSIERSVFTEVVAAKFAHLMAGLNDTPFWKVAVEQNSYVPTGGLWAPQRRAVGLSLTYIAARLVSPGKNGAALVKMPTGTGKTGVIATLSCAVPDIKRVLVITPRRALVDQMVADLHTRLWNRFGMIYDGRAVRERIDGDPPVGTLSKGGPIHRLLPSEAKTLAELPDERIVMVGTFAALEQILRPDRPAHRLSGRRPVGSDEIPPDGDEDEVSSEKARTDLIALLQTFDLVIVDESHYEPAYIWSQCIRNLNLPTVLFSATPYRNDFRYFDIDGRFAFSLSFREAVERRLIRDVQVLKVDKDTVPGESFSEKLIRFGDLVQKSINASRPEDARIIVRAESHESLSSLRAELVGLGEKCVLIHHKEGRANAKALRFRSVTEAVAAPETEGVRFWLHQWKLLEGVDDSRFAGVAVFEPFSTSRAVVQQIGRVLRYGRRENTETALVMGNGELGLELDDRFSRYLGYEVRFEKDPAEALKRETNYYEMLRTASPDVQYIAGDFRNRFDSDDEPVTFADIQLPLRALVLRKTRANTLDAIAEASQSAMGLEDRHDMSIVSAQTPDEPSNMRLITYVLWSNSPLLTRRAMPTWTLGVMALVEVGDRIFVLDTEGLVVDPEKLGLQAEEPATMQRLVPAASTGESSRVTVASAVSLDLSDMGIRAVTARMRDFGTSFYDLAQGMQAATSVRAQMKMADGSGLSRYLSLQRASVSDATGRYVSAKDYAGWVSGVATQLDSPIAVSRAFARFAQASPAPAPAKAIARNVLFDFADIIGEDGTDCPADWDQDLSQALSAADRCVDVEKDGSFSLLVGNQPFSGKLKYEVTGAIRRRGRYIVESPMLDEKLVKRSVTKKEKPQLLSGMLTREQAFRVIPTDPSLIYAQRHFYTPAMSIGEIAKDQIGGPLEHVIASAWLAKVASEKGAAADTLADWTSKSVFGGIYAHMGFAGHGSANTTFQTTIRSSDASFADLMDQFTTVVCDDGGTELCDFICVDEKQRRVVLIHAKVDDTKMSLNSIQAVGRQAQASVAFLTSIHDFPDRKATWNTKVPITGGSLATRLLKGPGNITATWNHTRDAIRSARYSREVWIVAGKILGRKKLVTALKQPEPSAQARQMIYYIASLQTSAARANVGLKIFCSP
ncbi:DEAD/DEAH box helicase [Sinorhizobium meliloti]|nr:DEAD/DEAH box helicase [Sinorhizobium meliloti]RVL88355.1 DEAD/DEAH box helicase [Sinorhizobium meliloti]